MQNDPMTKYPKSHLCTVKYVKELKVQERWRIFHRVEKAKNYGDLQRPTVVMFGMTGLTRQPQAQGENCTDSPYVIPFLRSSNFGRLMHHVTYVSTFKTTIASIRQASMNSGNRKHLPFFPKSKSHCPDTHSNTRPLFFLPTLRCPLTTRRLHH